MRFYVFDGQCYQLMLDELRDAYQLDSRIPKMIGVSRQAFHAYLQGHIGPKNDRAKVIRSIVPSAFKLVGRVH